MTKKVNSITTRIFYFRANICSHMIQSLAPSGKMYPDIIPESLLRPISRFPKNKTAETELTVVLFQIFGNSKTGQDEWSMGKGKGFS